MTLSFDPLLKLHRQCALNLHQKRFEIVKIEQWMLSRQKAKLCVRACAHVRLEDRSFSTPPEWSSFGALGQIHHPAMMKVRRMKIITPAIWIVQLRELSEGEFCGWEYERRGEGRVEDEGGSLMKAVFHITLGKTAAKKNILKDGWRRAIVGRGQSDNKQHSLHFFFVY